MNAAPLLEVNHLQLETRHGAKRVVDDISFAVMRGQIVGIVGESGSGKSMTARAVMRLEPPAIERVAGGILFDSQDVTRMPPKQLRQMRGAQVGMVFQEPMTSLNPSMTIGRQLDEGLALHSDYTAARRRELTLQMLTRIGIQDPEKSLTAYPHHFSGGMRQRIMLAAVMLVRPALLIADEPTTALDAIVQRDVLELMVELTREQQTAVLLISHDLPMVARYTDKIIVMERGRIVEQGTTADIIATPKHPYTRKLLSSLPSRGPARDIDRGVTPVVQAKDIVVDYPGRGGLFRKIRTSEPCTVLIWRFIRAKSWHWWAVPDQEKRHWAGPLQVFSEKPVANSHLTVNLSTGPILPGSATDTIVRWYFRIRILRWILE